MGNVENSPSPITAFRVNGNLFAKNLQRRDDINNALRKYNSKERGRMREEGRMRGESRRLQGKSDKKIKFVTLANFVFILGRLGHEGGWCRHNEIN